FWDLSPDLEIQIPMRSKGKPSTLSVFPPEGFFFAKIHTGRSKWKMYDIKEVVRVSMAIEKASWKDVIPPRKRNKEKGLKENLSKVCKFFPNCRKERCKFQHKPNPILKASQQKKP